MRNIVLFLSEAFFTLCVAFPLVLAQSVLPASTPPAPVTTTPQTTAPADKPMDSPVAAASASGKARATKTGKSGKDASSSGAALRSEDGTAFVIGSEDVLGIRVWDEPNLSGPMTVGPDGMISLQLIHEVKAAGLTTVQLEALLTERLKEYRNNPEVSVQVVQVRSRKYILQGGVARTGTFPLTGPTTVLEALVNGGGFKEFSDTKKIYILRKGPDGKTIKIKFNYKEVTTNKHMEQNILVQNGDFIIVPE